MWKISRPSDLNLNLKSPKNLKMCPCASPLFEGDERGSGRESDGEGKGRGGSGI